MDALLWILWAVLSTASFAAIEVRAIRQDKSDADPYTGTTLSAFLRRLTRRHSAIWFIGGGAWLAFTAWFTLHIWVPSTGV